MNVVMRRSVLMSVLAGVLALPLAWAVAEDAPAPKEKVKANQVKPIKVSGHYAKLDLSDDQKQQIKAIQDDIKQKMMKLREEEASRIDAVLTAEQKQQLAEMKPEPKTDGKMKGDGEGKVEPKAKKQPKGKEREGDKADTE